MDAVESYGDIRCDILAKTQRELIIKTILEHSLKKEREIMERKIKKLEREIEELRHRPGNSGYLEAMEDFDNLIKKKMKAKIIININRNV